MRLSHTHTHTQLYKTVCVCVCVCVYVCASFSLHKPTIMLSEWKTTDTNIVFSSQTHKSAVKIITDAIFNWWKTFVCFLKTMFLWERKSQSQLHLGNFSRQQPGKMSGKCPSDRTWEENIWRRGSERACWWRSSHTADAKLQISQNGNEEPYM